MKNWLAIIGLMAALLSGAACAHPYISQATLAGTAELIVVGKVTAVQETPGTMKKIPGGISLTSGKGRATVAVEQTLKGPALKSVIIHYQTPPKTRQMHMTYNLKVGQRFLFSLIERNGSYSVQRDIRNVTDVPTIQKIIAELPVVTLEPPSIVTQQSDAYHIHVSNHGLKDIIIEVRLLDELMEAGGCLFGTYGTGNNADFQITHLADTPDKPITVQPGKAINIPVGATVSMPAELVLANLHVRAFIYYHYADAPHNAIPNLVSSEPITVLYSPHEPLTGAPVTTYQRYL